MDGIRRQDVLELVRQSKGDGVTGARLVRQLGVRAGRAQAREEVEAALAELEARGEVVRGSSGRVTAVEYTDCYRGTLRQTASGFGVLRVADAELPDIVIPPERLATALDGDEVLVFRGQRRLRGRLVPEKYGQVVRVLRRRRLTMVGRFVPDRVQPLVLPFNRRVKARVLLAPWEGPSPREGELVEVAVSEFGEGGLLEGRLVRRLGLPEEPGVAEEVVLAESGIPVEMPPEALAEAAALPAEVLPHELEGRRDFRDQPAVTIDPETARDHDDAVAAFEHRNGAIEVFVHIADVSHYVRPGSAVDAAARERGTSVYLPGRCVPMLPEALSSHLCSLREGVDRLTFSVRFLVTPGGGVEGYRAERGVIRSRRRCTYSEVRAWLEDGSWPGELAAEARRSLVLAGEAAARLGQRRAARGSIDFDLPEPEILLDPEGFMTGTRTAERNVAHRLIEELMIAANECVARLLKLGRQPALFRIHEPPSPGKLAELAAILAEFGIELKGDLEDLPPRSLQRVLAQVEGRPEERLVHALTLRALARAVYHPECRGHYALATEYYLHFTSPIRRYPDLVVHRMLTELLAGRVLQGGARRLVESELEELAPHCSFTERRAADAEREVVRWKQAEYMQRRIGEEFGGHVTGVVAFGLFVMLDELFVEGLVHVSTLGDDLYRYDEKGHRLVGTRFGRVLRLGDALRVRVRGVDEETMEVKLEPILEPLAPARGRRPAARTPGSLARTPAQRRHARRARS
ncbi:MAG TPA: ribonuclease R [Thermoanaerobaculaceae bacterium]|nr:ribonuclease R [Thermoanaerobaculaceae bacterium]HRS17381.1 ribonuclease R [Thermoanaerobaculaceae bacterium]